MAICGLDFGTSNSTVGVVKNNHNTMVPLELDSTGDWHSTLPSALFFDFETDDISFGRSAIAQYTSGHSGRLMRSMKSLLGSSTMNDKTQIKRRFYTYDEIISFFVSSLKHKAEEYLQSDVNGNGGHSGNSPNIDSVVIGRPVFFNDDDPTLDKSAESHLADIAKLAGFKHVSFQYEPIAAAFDYEQQVSKEELALIVDIGGGTSDFTLIRLSPERHQQPDRKSDFLGNHGVHIGGTDFDRRLSMAGVMPWFGLGSPLKERPSLSMPANYYFELATWHRIHLLYERGVQLELNNLKQQVQDKASIERLLALLQRRKGHHLAALVEQAKIELSAVETTEVPLHKLFDNGPDSNISNDVQHTLDLAQASCPITRQQLQQSLERDIDSIFTALSDTLQQAGLTTDSVDTVFTTGGSTALPMIKTLIGQTLPNARLVDGDLYTSVGSGLLMEARKRYQ
jgi:hypothetical chaperone protein